jgi:mannose-1-phosphate guanylyltransferase
LSRTHFPKQFIPFDNSFSLLQNTVERLHDFDSAIVVSNQNHRFLVAEQLRDIDASVDIIIEPCGRNTAPAIALAAFTAVSRGKSDEVMTILPSDHYIADIELFRMKVQKAEALAQQGKVVLFGIVPKRAETGYGYIKVDSSAVREGADCSFDILQFTEKPEIDLAEKYVASGNFLWNSGIYSIRADRYLELLQEFCPEIYHTCTQAYQNAVSDMDFIRVAAEPFENCPSLSIDHAIMEPLCGVSKSAAVVLPLALEWSDLGSWLSLWEHRDKDQYANVVEGDVLLSNTENSLVLSRDRLVAAVGVENMVIVDTPDALLVASKDRVQDVKHIVEKLKQSQRDEYIKHREVYRPWGKYDLIGHGDGFQVKQITVNPGAKLSLQKHEHRAEHWVVVKGVADIQKGDERFTVEQNQSTFIPLGQIHSLVNSGSDELVMIEVQSGDYLGEDDIVRYEDLYGRV